MINKLSSVAGLVLAMNIANEQTPGKNINSRCGCFNVGFKYAEIFYPIQIINCTKRKLLMVIQ